MKKIRPSFALCLILSSLAIGGCAHGPAAVPFDAAWEFYQPTPDAPVKACIGEADVAKLRELLIRCEGNR